MKSAYLVLDMQNDLVHEDGPSAKGPLGAEVRRRQVVATTRRAIDKARAANLPIVFVRVGFSPDYRECPPHSPLFGAARQHGLYKLGSWGTEIHADLGASDADFVVVKHRVSPFYGTNLEVFLRAHGIQRIFASGVSTTAVVQATVRDAHDRDYVCSVIEDGCAAATSDEHEQSIAMLRRFATVTTSDDVDFAAV